MLKYATIILLALFGAVSARGESSKRDLDGRMDSLLRVLDQAVADKAQYEEQRQAGILKLHSGNQRTPQFSAAMYDNNRRLIEQFKQFQCDSAIMYLNRNVEIAERLNDSQRSMRARLDLSSILEQAGLYKESVDRLESVDERSLTPEMLSYYYFNYSKVLRSLGERTKDRLYAERYIRRSERYDSLLLKLVVDRTDEFALKVMEEAAASHGDWDKALKINDARLASASQYGPEFALAAYNRAVICERMGERGSAKWYLALSALSDVRTAIKDYASLWMLAEILFEDGDVDRAYRYIRTSWEDARFYNARLRPLQTSGLLAMIDETYKIRLQEKNDTMRLYMWLIMALVVLLSAALFFILGQMRHLQTMRNDLREANARLGELNESLRQTNHNLQESNRIKEQYIGRFLNLCSVHLDKLDAYRRMVNKNIRAGRTEQLAQLTASKDAINSDLEELYKNFDTALLQLFPDFVTKFNSLLRDDEAIVPKRGELLNTELRIFALIRLGIDDSESISEFLRYSLNTIYNYRAKVRNKAKVPRDEFEEFVKKIQ